MANTDPPVMYDLTDSQVEIAKHMTKSRSSYNKIAESLKLLMISFKAGTMCITVKCLDSDSGILYKKEIPPTFAPAERFFERLLMIQLKPCTDNEGAGGGAQHLGPSKELRALLGAPDLCARQLTRALHRVSKKSAKALNDAGNEEEAQDALALAEIARRDEAELDEVRNLQFVVATVANSPVPNHSEPYAL